MDHDDVTLRWPVRFRTKVDIRASDECWPWLGVLVPSGYGQYWLDGKMRNAHRVAVELSSGEPVPKGHVVMHLCDNPPCCNPKHLRIGTQRDNIHDAMSKNRSPKGETHGCAILTEEQVVHILGRHENATIAARRYNVARATIHDIRQGLSWTHLTAKQDAR